jgi:glycosyltransferase involved in cell wall biosynthesis
MGPISGADETLVTYATQLTAAGHAVSVLLMYPHARDDQFYVRLSRAGVEVSTVASARVGASLGAGRKVAAGLLRALPPTRRLLRRQAHAISSGVTNRYFGACRDYFARCGADVVHALTPDPSVTIMIAAARAAGVPVLYQELGTPYQPPAFRAYYESFCASLPLCNEVAALSPRLAAQCRAELPMLDALSILPVMTDDILETDASRDETRATRDEMRAMHTETRDTITFGFAARLEELKSPLTLVEAFARVRRELACARLSIAGAGSQKKMIAARAAALGVAAHCRLHGAYAGGAGKGAFMRSLDVFVLPSLTEGTPNCVAEAMAHGLPVIASNVGGIPDMITPETGLLVPPRDARALAEAMTRLASDASLRARMGRASRGRYEELFAPASVLPVLLDTYQRVASADASAPSSVNATHPWARGVVRGREEPRDATSQDADLTDDLLVTA